MRVIRVGVWCVVAAVLAGVPGGAAQVGEKVPRFTCTAVDGTLVSSADFAGKVTAICFTASWVKRAGEELQYLQGLAREAKGKNLLVVPIVEREDKGRAVELATSSKLTLKLLLDSGQVAKLFGVNGLPDLFIVDNAGTIRSRIIGFGPASPESIRKAILPLLNAPSPAKPARRPAPPAPPTPSDKSDIPAALRAYAHLQLGAAHVNIGDVFINAGQPDGGHYAEAVKELKAGLAIEPKNVDLLVWLGVADERRGDLNEAVHQYQAALAINPEQSYAREGLRRLRGLPAPPPPPALDTEPSGE